MAPSTRATFSRPHELKGPPAGSYHLGQKHILSTKDPRNTIYHSAEVPATRISRLSLHANDGEAGTRPVFARLSSRSTLDNTSRRHRLPIPSAGRPATVHTSQVYRLPPPDLPLTNHKKNLFYTT